MKKTDNIVISNSLVSDVRSIIEEGRKKAFSV